MDKEYAIFDLNRIQYYPYTRRMAKGCPYLHAHTFWEICYVLNGSMENDFQSGRTLLELTDVAIIRPDDRHKYVNQSKDLDYRDLYIDCEVMKSVCDMLSPNLYNDLLSEKKPVSFKLDIAHINSIEKSASIFDGATKREAEFDKAFKRFVLRIVSLYLDNRMNLTDSYSMPRFLTDLIKFIDKNPAEIDCDSVIKKVNYSHSHVSRLFVKYLGMSLQNYIIQARLRYSADLILNKENKIVYIAQVVGYSSQNSFIKAFKKYYNCSPTQYRKNKLKK